MPKQCRVKLLFRDLFYSLSSTLADTLTPCLLRAVHHDVAHVTEVTPANPAANLQNVDQCTMGFTEVVVLAFGVRVESDTLQRWLDAQPAR